MIENTLFLRGQEKACLNGVQMEYGTYEPPRKMPATVDCQRNLGLESQKGHRSDANENSPPPLIQSAGIREQELPWLKLRFHTPPDAR